MHRWITNYRIRKTERGCTSWEVLGLDDQDNVLQSLGLFYSEEMANLFLNALPDGCDEPSLNQLDRGCHEAILVKTMELIRFIEHYELTGVLQENDDE